MPMQSMESEILFAEFSRFSMMKVVQALEIRQKVFHIGEILFAEFLEI